MVAFFCHYHEEIGSANFVGGNQRGCVFSGNILLSSTNFFTPIHRSGANLSDDKIHSIRTSDDKTEFFVALENTFLGRRGRDICMVNKEG